MFQTHKKIWFIGLGLSAVVHGAFLGTIGSKRFRDTVKAKPDAVKVRVVETKPEPPPPPEEPKPPPPPPPEPKKEKKKPPPPKTATERQKPKEPPKEPPKPVQGLDPNSFAKDGKAGFSAPMGNTLMTEDTGERVDKPPPPMDADLSADAQLIRDSVRIPKYTDQALDANLEGYITVDVFVDELGNVTEAELRKPVGYGMDARIIESARQARFVPRKNRLGRAEAGWTVLKFNLQIP